MRRGNMLRLHWRLFFPLVGLLWLIIGMTIVYFVHHEKQRQKENLENRLINVNNTVVDAYERGDDLQKTVDFIRLFTGNTTLDPLRITVYDDNGAIIADNPEATIDLRDSDGHIVPGLENLWHSGGHATVRDMAYDDTVSMISSRTSSDGAIHTFAALPYEGEVLSFLSYNPMVWIVVVLLGVLISVMSYFGVRAICRNVYSLQEFASAISSDRLTDDVGKWKFSNDELGDVSRYLVRLYSDKIHAEQEKTHHEHQIGINISHELNTPVSIIKGYLDTVLADTAMPDDMKRKFLLRAQQNTNRLASLVSDVSMVTRLGENNLPLPCDRIDFNRFAGLLVEDIRKGHVADSMVFDYDIPQDCHVMAHESLLTNALLNLAYNSGKYSGGTRMMLRWIRKEEDCHVFTFSDDGCGVDEKHLGRLFDLFYRVDAGRTRKNGGSGLGLPLVRRIIMAMGGGISVANGNKGGLEFTFSIPAAN